MNWAWRLGFAQISKRFSRSFFFRRAGCLGVPPCKLDRQAVSDVFAFRLRSGKGVQGCSLFRAQAESEYRALSCRLEGWRLEASGLGAAVLKASILQALGFQSFGCSLEGCRLKFQMGEGGMFVFL